jgi:uncharacterized protein DUF6308
VTLDLLDGALGDDAAAFLERIPTSVPLWDDGAAELIDDRGPAVNLWRLMESQGGVGWVTAGKLLARKRPFPGPGLRRRGPPRIRPAERVLEDVARDATPGRWQFQDSGGGSEGAGGTSGTGHSAQDPRCRGLEASPWAAHWPRLWRHDVAPRFRFMPLSGDGLAARPGLLS